VTGEVWICLEQNSIDTAVNKSRNHLCACGLDTLNISRAKALLLPAHLSHRNSVRLSVSLSVRLSHGWISQKRCNLGSPNLHFRKSYTGSQLAPNSITLNDLERQNREFYGFFGDFGLQHKSISFTRWRHETIVMRSR